MKKQKMRTINSKGITKLKNLKPLSKNQLETVIGGPETSRGTTTHVGT